MKKVLIGLLAGVIIGLVPAAYAMILMPKQFTDVTHGDWFYEAINGLSYAQVVDGYPDGTFKPHQNITRAEASKLIYEVYAKVNIQNEFNVLKQQYDALNAKVSTLDFPGDCYYENQWFQDDQVVDEDSYCTCNIDGRVTCPELL